MSDTRLLLPAARPAHCPAGPIAAGSPAEAQRHRVRPVISPEERTPERYRRNQARLREMRRYRVSQSRIAIRTLVIRGQKMGKVKATGIAAALVAVVLGAAFGIFIAFRAPAVPVASDVLRSDGFTVMSVVPASGLSGRVTSAATGTRYSQIYEIVFVIKPKYENVIGQYKKEVETRSGGTAHVTIDGDVVRTIMNVLVYRFMFTNWEAP